MDCLRRGIGLCCARGCPRNHFGGFGAPWWTLAVTVLVGCATSEDIPILGAVDGAVPLGDGAPMSAGGDLGAGGGFPGGAGGFTSTGGGVGTAGVGGSGNASGTGGSTSTCGGMSCPSCLITGLLGVTCCKTDGTCGCKAFFGVGACM